ncbi:MAG: hypothetical protein ACR2RV_05625 [Verrucomicrobiales bacterium]
MKKTNTSGLGVRGMIFCCLAAIAMSGTTSFAETRELEDKFGRIVSGELISHKGATAEKVKVKIKGKVHDIPVDKFCDRDQKVIRAWMKETPPTINYSFDVEALKKKQSTVRQRNYYYNSGNKSDMYVFEVEVTNTSTEPVSDLKIVYQAVLEDKVGLSEYGSYYSRAYGKGLMVIEDTIKVKGPLKYNQSASFVTKPFKIDTTRYSYYYSTSSKLKDSILGCRVRVYDATGKLQEDYRTKNTKFAKLNLDGGGSKTEVTIE